MGDRIRRQPEYSLGDVPVSHLINDLFHQGGEHRNLFDFALLTWALEKSGFQQITRTSEPEFLARFPEFPPRRDEQQSLYVFARPTLLPSVTMPAARAERRALRAFVKP